jgi:hypothetical protein
MDYVAFSFSTRPPFIEINGFHITYDELYDSFKARGLVGNNVMSLWSYQFNLDHLQLYEEKKTRDKKFAFPQLATVILQTCDFVFQSEFLNLIFYLAFFIFFYFPPFLMCDLIGLHEH